VTEAAPRPAIAPTRPKERSVSLIEIIILIAMLLVASGVSIHLVARTWGRRRS